MDVTATTRSSRVSGPSARSACRLGERNRKRVEDARPRGVARKRRRDHRVDEKDAVRQSERRSAEDRDEPVADPRAETALHHGPRDQEGQHDQQNRAV